MPVRIDHVAVAARDKHESAHFFAEVFGLPAPAPFGPGTINRNDGGRGLYFDDPSGHHLEILTRRYGSGPA